MWGEYLGRGGLGYPLCMGREAFSAIPAPRGDRRTWIKGSGFALGQSGSLGP